MKIAKYLLTILVFLFSCSNQNMLPLNPSNRQLRQIKHELLNALNESSAPGTEALINELQKSKLKTPTRIRKNDTMIEPYIGNWYLMKDLKSLRYVKFDEDLKGRMIYDVEFVSKFGKWKILDEVKFKIIGHELSY
ncbi:MAG: hypothetical protein ACETVT_00770 [bacterium]